MNASLSLGPRTRFVPAEPSEVELRRLPRWPVVLGLLGSTTMALAGSGLTRISGTTTPLPWFFALPVGWSGGHEALLEACYYGGLALLTASWLVLGRSLRPGHRPDLHALWAAAAIWSVPLVVGPALGSTDLYAYLAQAAVIHTGLNPYRFGPVVLGHSRLLASVPPLWRDAPADYGPLFLALATIVGAATGWHISAGVLGMRLLAVGGLVVVARYVPRLAVALRADPVRATWLAVASPFMLVEFVMAGHNDIVMIALVLAALVMREEGRPVLAIALCALGVMVKAPATLALGFVALAWIGNAHGWRSRLWRGFEAGAVAGVVMAGTSLAVGLGWGWLNPGILGGPSRVVTVTTPSNAVGLLLGGIMHDAGSHVDTLVLVHGAELVGLVGAALFCVGVLRRAVVLGWTRSIGICLLAVAIMAPGTRQWYLAWGLVILATTSPSQRSILMAAAGAAVEITYGPLPMPVALWAFVLSAAVFVAVPYWLGWSYRHLMRRLPSGGPDSFPLVAKRTSQLMAPARFALKPPPLSGR
jgi:hypothetical protein